MPEDGDISWAVSRILMNRLVGPSGMQVKHLQQWLISATQDNLPDANNRQKVLAIVQSEFREGTLSKECTWQTVVLFPRG